MGDPIHAVTVLDTAPAVLSPADLPRYGELPERLTLDVTSLDIFFGIKESGNQCPIACAFRRALEAAGVNVLSVDVGLVSAEVMLRDQAYDKPWVEYTHDAFRWVRDFDAGIPVAPRAVTLTLTRPRS